MTPEPDKPTRLGITPMGLLFLGYFVMLAVIIGFAQLLNFFHWLLDWLHQGK